MGVNIGIPRRTNAIHGRLEDIVLDGFTHDISYSYFSYKENGQPGKLGMITECLPPLIRSILSGSLEEIDWSIKASGTRRRNVGAIPLVTLASLFRTFGHYRLSFNKGLGKKNSHSRISRKSRKISTMDGRSPVSQKRVEDVINLKWALGLGSHFLLSFLEKSFTVFCESLLMQPSSQMWLFLEVRTLLPDQGDKEKIERVMNSIELALLDRISQSLPFRLRPF
ncbi:hypothetical protein T459_22107 [Capsicum annuum]|uniref:Uncharacterized protein n=1 Tax=Capsicum annuum TaxID=4072 RepID=A0A2G2YYJ4_CAPAN|nr:hypothetical protein T459_22107 [Capsicum annuum]